ncbi:MAG: DUF1156 domain-containing protein, partial [Pyrinomonadaceae bacterium]
NTDAEVSKGTVSRAKATCPCCNVTLSPDRVRAQLTTQRGGADVIFDDQGRRTGGAWLIAIVTLKPGEMGRHYRLPNELDYENVRIAQTRVAKLFYDWERSGKRAICPLPDEPLPPIGTLGFRVQRYGMLQWGDLFTARQKVSLSVIAHAISTNCQPALALALGKLADLSTSGCLWHTKNECPNQVFTQPALSRFGTLPKACPLRIPVEAFKCASKS